jgi:replicative DNA helicase
MTIDLTANIQAEQSVLGSLLLSPTSWDKIVELVTEKDFYRAEHQLIFRHISRIIERGGQLDTITLAESIQNTGKLDKVGGLSYIGKLESDTPTAANIVQYAKIVHSHRLEREFSSAAADIASLAESHEEISVKLEKAGDVLSRLVETDKSSTETLLEATAGAIEFIEARYASQDHISGLRTGFDDLDELTSGLQPSDLIILAGRPSMGKTALAINIAENAAMNGIPALVFSLEMSSPQLALRSISSLGKINLQRLRSGRLEDDDWSRLTAAASKIQDAPFFLDSNPMITASQMHSRAKQIKRKHGLGLIVIDYLQLMSEASGNTRNEELSSITRRLKLMAKDLNVPVILLSQLNRNLEARQNKRPVMSDLRESGAIEQDADLIAMIYRDEVYNPDSPNKGAAEIIITKQRMGPIGKVILSFEGEYSRFGNFSGQYQQEVHRKSSRGFGADVSGGKAAAAGE